MLVINIKYVVFTHVQWWILLISTHDPLTASSSMHWPPNKLVSLLLWYFVFSLWWPSGFHYDWLQGMGGRLFARLVTLTSGYNIGESVSPPATISYLHILRKGWTLLWTLSYQDRLSSSPIFYKQSWLLSAGVQWPCHAWEMVFFTTTAASLTLHSFCPVFHDVPWALWGC